MCEGFYDKDKDKVSIKQRKKDESTGRQLDKHTNRHTDKKTKPQLRQKRKRTICSPTFVREVLGQNKNKVFLKQKHRDEPTEKDNETNIKTDTQTKRQKE